MNGHESVWTLPWLLIELLILQLPSVTVYGCSCPRYPVSLCDDYESSGSVYVARVINATCSCIPDSGYYDTNSGYSFYANTKNVSCVSAALDSGEVVSEIVVRATCDVYDSYNILPCKNTLTIFAGIIAAIVSCNHACMHS